MSGWNFPDDLIEAAWSIIANAKDWHDDDRVEWIEAAERWRDAYHKHLDTLKEV